MNNMIHPMEPEELMAYLDGELSKDRTAVAAAHLSECAECRELVAGLRGVSQGMEAWEVRSTDFRVSPALADALDGSTAMPRKISVIDLTWRKAFRQYWKPAAWVGAVATVTLVAYMGTGFRERKLLMPLEESHPTDQVATNTSIQGYTPARSAAHPTVLRGRLEQSEMTAEVMAPPPAPPVAPASKGIARSDTGVPTVSGPMIIRTAQLALITKDFDNARSAIEALLKRHHGYVGDLKVGGSTGSGRTLTATLRVPADQLDASLAEMKTLGRVESESQSGEDVTSQFVDLQARLANSRNTEQRLKDLLRQRTGELSDVLEVEQEVARVRGEIEQMEAERKNMSNRVSFATLNATITEDYKAQLQVVPPSTSTRLSNAAVEGYKSMVEGVMSLALFFLENGPTLLLWIAILFLPARLVWKRVRRSFAH
jgi:hypothetical protein